MNLYFIKNLPKIEGASLITLGREVEEGLVPEFIPSEKIEKYKKEVKI